MADTTAFQKSLNLKPKEFMYLHGSILGPNGLLQGDFGVIVCAIMVLAPFVRTRRPFTVFMVPIS